MYLLSTVEWIIEKFNLFIHLSETLVVTNVFPHCIFAILYSHKLYKRTPVTDRFFLNIILQPHKTFVSCSFSDKDFERSKAFLYLTEIKKR